MRKRTLNKIIGKSFIQSKGRFISIMLLVMLGSMTFIGLKVTGPNIDHSSDVYYGKQNTLDLAVISDYGLDDKDKKEIETLVKDSQVEFGYFVDATIDNSSKAFRLFSKPESISKFDLVSGKLPQSTNEIAICSVYNKDYRIGDTIKFTEKDPDKSLLKEKVYIITGFVNSSEIISKYAMGNSSSGSGTLEGYGLVPKKSFKSEVYTIARLRYNSLRKFNSSSDLYHDRLAVYQKQLEDALKDNPSGRLNYIKSQANDRIKKGRDKIREAEKKLKDGESKISQSQDTINSKKNELNYRRIQLESSKRKLDQGKKSLDKGKADLRIKGETIADAKAKLSPLKVQLDNTKKELDKKEEELYQMKSMVAKARSDLQMQEIELKNQGLDPASVDSYTSTKSKADKDESDLVRFRGEVSQAREKYLQGLKEYDKGMEPIIRFEQAESNLANQENQYNVGMAQYRTGKDKIDRAFIQIEKAQGQLDEKKETFRKEKTKALKEIGDAKSDLRDAQDEVNGLVKPTYTVCTRRTLPGGDGIKTVQLTSRGITMVSNIFTLILYLVAALVTMTTMTRFVNEERNNVGILKSLGYSDYDVMKKFVVYGFVAGTSGSMLGSILGTYGIPHILCTSLLADMTLPPIYLDWDWSIVGLALVCSVMCSILPAVYVACRELRETTSQLLLPKPPSKGSRILLERVTLIWKRMTFTQKVTARNIFRYKQRMFMTIFGVAGSVALLLAGLGIASSIYGIKDRQYQDIIKYDAVVVKQNKVVEDEQKKLNDMLGSSEIKEYLLVYTENISKRIDKEDSQVINLMVTGGKTFSPYISLQSRDSKQKLHLSGEGAILSEKLANIYEVKIGDTITLEDDLDGHKIKVAGITEMYAGHFIFMNSDYYNKIYGRSINYNSYLVTMHNHSAQNVKDVSSKFMDLRSVKGVSQNTSVIAQVETMTKSLTQVMIVLTVMSLLLAIVILYNLNNINMAERIRELSTIKVLGFFNNEVVFYIYRETIILSVIGVVIGTFLGKILHRVIIKMVPPDNIMFEPDINIIIYIIPVLAIILILLILGSVVGSTLKKVDMLEALKSVD